MNTGTLQIKPVKPVLMANLKDAMVLLGADRFPDDSSIHDVRVLMKKARAAMKLIQPLFPAEDLKKDITALREVGRKMQTWREATVARKYLRDLRKEYPDLFSNLADNERITRLIHKPDVGPETSAALQVEVDQIREILRKTAARIRFRSITVIDTAQLFIELGNSYCRVRDIYFDCRNIPRPGKFHEFRKLSKDLLYQLYFFRTVDQSKIKALEKKLDVMTRNLGRINDLNQLLKLIGYKRIPRKKPQAMDELMVRIRERQDRYSLKVWKEAPSLFSAHHYFPGIHDTEIA
jgi:CHAD domain-containing protein